MQSIEDHRQQHMDTTRKIASYFVMSIVFGMILLLFFGCDSTPFKVDNLNAPGHEGLFALNHPSKYALSGGGYFDNYSIIEEQHLITEEITGVVEVIARDVKIQVGFNEDMVLRYRLIGYENLDIDDDAFTRGTFDAGEIDGDLRVNALYVAELSGILSGELVIVHLGDKLPYGTNDISLEFPFNAPHLAGDFASSSSRFQLVVGVVEIG